MHKCSVYNEMFAVCMQKYQHADTKPPFAAQDRMLACGKYFNAFSTCVSNSSTAEMIAAGRRTAQTKRELPK